MSDDDLDSRVIAARAVTTSQNKLIKEVYDGLLALKKYIEQSSRSPSYAPLGDVVHDVQRLIDKIESWPQRRAS